jgi:hypothetical protein
LEAAVLGVVMAEPLDASLHSEPELATSAAASRDTAALASLRRSDGATRPGVSVTPAGLVDGRKRKERPNAWLLAPLPDGLFPIFLASASASAKRGSSVQLRCRERARGASSLTRWSASVATDVDGGGGGAGDKGDGGALLLPLLLPVEEEGQSERAIETATGDVVVAGSDRETERRALWRTGESAEVGRSDDRPGSSVPEADVHRFEDDMARPARARHASYDIYDAFALDVGIGTLAVWRSNGRPAASGRERGRPASEANESAAFSAVQDSGRRRRRVMRDKWKSFDDVI